MTRYILIPQRQGQSQRITLPMEMLREKEWLKTDCYLMIDRGKDEVTLKPYLFNDTKRETEPSLGDSLWDNIKGEIDDN